MMKFQGAMSSFGVHPETSAALCMATDGLGDKANVVMLALMTFDDEEISCFVQGGDVVATQRYHGIPKQVYDSLAIPAESVADTLHRTLEARGITNLVCHQAYKFVKPILRHNKLVMSNMSFVDVGLTHKALSFWTDRLRESSNLIELQARIQRMRGANLIKLEDLTYIYEVAGETAVSPYIPLNKVRVVRDIFAAQLDTELPF